MNYNPYDLLQLKINGKPMHGRPFEFDSAVANQKTMKNAFGRLVKPTKLATVCPDCGQGLEINVKLDEPPFRVINYSCHHCHPAPKPLVDPFVNPLQSGRIPVADLDPLLHNPDKPLDKGSVGSVADRFEVPVAALPVAPSSVETDLAPNVVRDDKAQKKPEEKPKPERSALLEKADGLSEEFDDTGLVDEDE